MDGRILIYHGQKLIYVYLCVREDLFLASLLKI